MIDEHQRIARDYVRSVLRETGWEATTLARRAGLAPTTITRFLNSPKVTHSLSARSLAKVAAASGLALPAEFGGGMGSSWESGAGTESSGGGGDLGQAGEGAPPALAGPRDLPVMGEARGGSEGYFFDQGVIQSYAERPWFLMGVPTAYAVYVNGTSMEPVFGHGHLLYVNPTLPPAPGDDVVVQLGDGQGFVKRLVRRSAALLLLEQFGPPDSLAYDAAEVAAVHVVVAALKVRA
jgi:SOS-response transcriptional repressor LexA